jgi:hypothetical protein
MLVYLTDKDITGEKQANIGQLLLSLAAKGAHACQSASNV